MREQSPQNPLTPSQIGAGAPEAAWTAWVREQWAAVRVVQLDVTQFADVTDRVRVRAVVHLGSLSPADVRVEALGGAAGPAGWPEQEMGQLYSAQSYRNGTFVFEGLTASEALDGQQSLTVRVRPRGAHEELSDLRTVACSTRGQLERVARFSQSRAEKAEPDRTDE